MKKFLSIDSEFETSKILCDVSSIQSISNSNHTLHGLSVDYELSTLTQQCLEKTKVARDKIFRFYFVGEFAISPFSGMAISVLPEVMSRIAEQNKHSAIFRLLQHIPELCNDSDRV
jgi:hypothetical protein